MFLPALAAELFRSAVAILRAGEGATGEGTLARRLIAIHGQQIGQSYQSYQVVARKALRAVRAANLLDAATGTRPGLRQLPLIPQSPSSTQRYEYRTLITVENVMTGDVLTYVLDVDTDTRMSARELQDYVTEHLIDIDYRASRRGQLASWGSQSAVSTLILSVGRTR